MCIWDFCKIIGKGEMWYLVLFGEYEFRFFVLYVFWSVGGYFVIFLYDDIVKIYDMSDLVFWKVGYDIGIKSMMLLYMICYNN